MSKIINKFSLTWDEFIPELYLKQPRFTYSACGQFIKHPERIKKVREADSLKHLYRNELDKVYFAHDATYSDSKHLARGPISGTIWAADLAEVGSLSSNSVKIKYLLCVIDVFTKYAWVKPLKDKKGKTVLTAFIEIVNECNRQSNKLWVHQGREFYNKLMQDINELHT